jgi:ATP-binding cassette subfamily E protein 1
MIAGLLEPDEGEPPKETVNGMTLKVSYKPQYLEADYSGSVRMFLRQTGGKTVDTADFNTSVLRKLELEELLEHNISDLSGGELQRTAIAGCLAQEADIYLFDEPSAFLDIEQRLASSSAIRRIIKERRKTAFVVEHSILMADYLSDSLVVFYGSPGISGKATTVTTLRTGMNAFLREMEVSFRRDPRTGRPRVNKYGSQKDLEAKSTGHYYYSK